jgi:cytoskeletal protein CcmA (bactofilin family)
MSNQPNALLGRGSDFQGKLTFEGEVHIDGRFTGEIFSEGTLVVGEGAEVQAEIRVGTVIVRGNVTGNITATDGVELHAPASLRGNITSPALHIDKGVFFDGACQMTSGSSTTRAAAPRPVTAQVPVVAALQPQAFASATPPAMPQRPQSGIFPDPTRTTGELQHKF